MLAPYANTLTRPFFFFSSSSQIVFIEFLKHIQNISHLYFRFFVINHCVCYCQTFAIQCSVTRTKSLSRWRTTAQADSYKSWFARTLPRISRRESLIKSHVCVLLDHLCQTLSCGLTCWIYSVDFPFSYTLMLMLTWQKWFALQKTQPISRGI